MLHCIDDGEGKPGKSRQVVRHAIRSDTVTEGDFEAKPRAALQRMSKATHISVVMYGRWHGTFSYLLT